MKRFTKSFVCIFMAIALAVLSIGCSPAQVEDNHLWVLTDYHPSSLPYKLIDRVAAAFREQHPDATVEIESILTSGEERETVLERVRSQIMAGEGPDVYIMSWYTPLFSDVEHSMHNGGFQDITAYYDADDKLQKSRFSQSVMDAGVVDGKRYILPLYYNIPVLYVDKQQMTDAGLDITALGTGLSGLSEVVKILGAEALIAEPAMLYYYLPNMFSSLIDYQKERVVWNSDELIAFLNDYRNVMTEINGSDIPYANGTIGTHISHGDYWAQNGHCVYLGTLTELVQNLRLAKAETTDLAVIPVKNADGKVCANVTTYGAVGAGTGSPILAYDFLSKFLLEENQWADPSEFEGGAEGGMLTGCWPVLVDGSWSVISDSVWKRATSVTGSGSEAQARKRALKYAELEEDDFEVLSSAIDVVYFPVHGGTEYMQTIIDNLNPYVNPAAGEVAVDKLAEELTSRMQHHLSEG